MVRINLNRDYTALVDEADLPLLGGRKWHVCNGYVSICRPGIGRQYLHRLIANATPEVQVDHINGDRLDNRRENLRLCPQSKNTRNVAVKTKRAANPSRFKGVFRQAGKWRAQIMVDRKSVHLGYFDDEVEAAVAYNMAALEFHGEYANFNRNLLEV